MRRRPGTCIHVRTIASKGPLFSTIRSSIIAIRDVEI
jgi:hypothetical protein